MRINYLEEFHKSKNTLPIYPSLKIIIRDEPDRHPDTGNRIMYVMTRYRVNIDGKYYLLACYREFSLYNTAPESEQIIKNIPYICEHGELMHQYNKLRMRECDYVPKAEDLDPDQSDEKHRIGRLYSTDHPDYIPRRKRENEGISVTIYHEKNQTQEEGPGNNQ